MSHSTRKFLRLFVMLSLACTGLNVYAHNTILYTPMGNIKQDRQTQGYVYNPENQLIRDQLSAQSRIIYAYYANGLQAEETPPGQPPLYHFYAVHTQLVNSMQRMDQSNYLVSHGTALRNINGVLLAK